MEEVKKPPVSVTFFSAAIKQLVKQHGDRDASALLEDFRGALGEAEMLYKAMPLIEKKPKVSPAPSDGAEAANHDR